jgi:type III pantothenate kinase
MKKTLCFDFGNTRRKAAFFNDNQMAEVITLNSGSPEEIEDLVIRHQPDFTILASVVKHEEIIETFLSNHSQFHKIDQTSAMPFKSLVRKAETVGVDRLALCAAAVNLFPDSNILVIGMGTCITYNFVNKQHHFLGGAISPGLEMRFQSMHTQTAFLPLVKMDWNFPLIGYDTNTAILSGVAMGVAKEIDGIIEAYEEKFESLKVLLTGGDALHFAPLLKKRIFADPHLTFKGLYAISTINR